MLVLSFVAHNQRSHQNSSMISDSVCVSAMMWHQESRGMSVSISVRLEFSQYNLMNRATWLTGPHAPPGRYLHNIHHKYNKEHTLSPFAGLAFHPLDGCLQAAPYVAALFVVPAHALTFALLLFATGVWTTNIHDCIDGKVSLVSVAARPKQTRNLATSWTR